MSDGMLAFDGDVVNGGPLAAYHQHMTDVSEKFRDAMMTGPPLFDADRRSQLDYAVEPVVDESRRAATGLLSAATVVTDGDSGALDDLHALLSGGEAENEDTATNWDPIGTRR